MKILIAIVLMLNLFSLRAGHIIGGEMYYDYLGANQYRVYVSMYKDCDASGNWAPFDANLILAVYTGNMQVQVVNIPFPGSVSVPITYNNPCVTPPPGLCILNAVYTTVLTLPPTPAGYTLSYQRCCRKPQITNIINPGDVGFTLTSQIPGSANNNYQNSSPRFSNYPPGLLCNNDDLIHDQSATDPDGDQLVYSLVTPFVGGGPPPNAAPTAPAPPYFGVPWTGGFNAAAPLGPGASIAIDPNTGLLTASPNLTGLFVVGIRVQEKRNGVVISETLLDFLLQVFACNISLQAILPAYEDLPTFVSYCQGLDVQFVNDSWSNTASTSYYWDFGVPGITTDVSTQFAPSYTYPAPGIYDVMMVVNPGLPCTDTAWMTVNVNNELEASWTSQDSLCLIDNSFDFVATTTGPAGTTFEWDFGPNGSPLTATGQTVNNVSFGTAGYIPISVSASYGICNTEFIDSIYIFDEPVSEMVLPTDIECEGLTIDFNHNSQNATYYYWDFGVPGISTDVSTLENPTYTYPSAGTYDVTLITGTTPVCSDTATVSITLNEDLIISWTSEDSLCITDNSFNFDGTVSGPPHTVYTWNFPNGSPNSSNDIDVNNVSFSTTGSIPVTLTGAFDNCSESVTQTIYLWSAPTIDFDIKDGLQCAPFHAYFVDQSTAETQIYYDWDFGDGNTSTQQNPDNIYYDPGNYPVTLTIHTDHGCVDTLTLTQYDLVNVHPKPEAGFSVDPNYTDICHSLVNFTDESSGAVEFQYIYDDFNFAGFEQNPTHVYWSDGTHYPIQIVTNEWGCKDTARSQLFIEPFTLYAPNTFTPDGDEFNNVFLPIVYLDVKSWHLEIFNRWGERVFESYDVNQGWDGTNGLGRMVQDGTYVWQITYISCEPIDPERVIQGHITLIR